MLNKVIIMGRLTKDPELRHTRTSAIPVTSFSVAVDRNYSKDKEKETDFFDVIAWQARAEFVAKHFTKGQPICIEGRLQQRKYTDNSGITRYVVEIIAESVHFAGHKKDDANSYGNAGGSGFDPFAEEAA